LSKIALSPNASGTGTFTVAAPNTNTDYTLTLPEGTGTVVANNVNSAIVSGTAVASTSGTSIDFTGLPSWVKRITVMFNGVSTNGTSNYFLQIGDSGGIETTGYVSGVLNGSAAPATATSTSAFLIDASVGAAQVDNGMAVITNLDGNLWVCNSILNNAGVSKIQGGTKTLSATLDRIRITTANGTDTFDAGSINILYE
jgi:hypothetical protein